MGFVEQIAFSACIFSVVSFLMSKFVFKPYLMLLERREARTIGDEANALKIREGSKQLKKKIDEALNDARMQGIKKREHYIGKAKEDAEEVIGSATLKARLLVEAAKQEISELKVKANSDISSQVSLISEQLMARITDSKQIRTIH